MISLEWVKDYIDIEDQDLHELADKVTKAGINIEQVVSNHINNLVIGKVVECEDIEGTHLHKCIVDIGEKIQIICGASNVRKGIKVIVALPGAILPGDFQIKASKIKGEDSNGMICALFELGLEEKTEENYNKGIHELDDSAPIGEDPFKYLNLDTTLYELDVHKHRNNDCYYHIGFAYELASILNRKVKLPEMDYKEIKESTKDNFNLKVDTDKCTYYLAKLVKDVTIKESPEFIKKRLIDAGMRPINNVVDISNYVMLEYGQPLHFFDKDKLGDTILVRQAKNNEELVTLDNIKRDLIDTDIVITDSKKPVCLAGVMGGLNTEVDESTKNILIEAAIFNPINIRNTSERLNLKSEASIRYGKGLNFEYTDNALNRACHLLEKYADAKICSDIVKYDNEDKSLKTVEFKASEVNKLLGIEISEKDMEKELDRLDFKYEIKKDKFVVTIPRRRLDIDPYVNDIAEEIGRLYGYHNLKNTLPKVDIKKGEYAKDVKLRKDISKRLRNLGITETMSYTLVSPELSKLFDYENKNKLVLPNPMSIDKSVVRTTLIPSLLNTYTYNKARKVTDINIYEISKTYDREYNEDIKVSVLMKGNYLTNNFEGLKVKTNYYVIKGVLENLLNYLGFKNRYSYIVDDIPNMHPGMSAKVLLDRQEIGIIGRVHPSINKDDIFVFEISLTKLLEKTIKPIKYKEASKYPVIKKDIALVMDMNESTINVEQVIKKAGGRLLSDIEVFDLYIIDDNKKSIAYSLTFKDNTRTLTEEEVMNQFNQIIESCEKSGYSLREK